MYSGLVFKSVGTPTENPPFQMKVVLLWYTKGSLQVTVLPTNLKNDHTIDP